MDTFLTITVTFLLIFKKLLILLLLTMVLCFLLSPLYIVWNWYDAYKKGKDK